MAKRTKQVRSRALQLDLRPTLEAGSFEDAVGKLEMDLRAGWKGKNVSGDAERQALESGWAKDLLTALMHVRFAIGRGDAEAAALQTLKLAVTMKAFEYAFCYGEDQQKGVKLSKAGHLGASIKSGGTIRRDLQMAREFTARSGGMKGQKSDTALMADIGRSQQKPLGPSASYDAIMRGLHALVQDKEAALERAKAEGERLKDSIRSGAKPNK